MTGIPTDYGWRRNREWNIGAKQALYHLDGTFYMPLEHFPGALCDEYGYILFHSREEYQTCSYILIGERVNVPGGISKIPGYRKMR